MNIRDHIQKNVSAALPHHNKDMFICYDVTVKGWWEVVDALKFSGPIVPSDKFHDLRWRIQNVRQMILSHLRA